MRPLIFVCWLAGVRHGVPPSFASPSLYLNTHSHDYA